MYDNCHIQSQVTIDPLRRMPNVTQIDFMQKTFRDALIWHLDNEEPKLADLVRATGVSRDALNKVRARPDASTDVEKAVPVARFYGKTVEQFLNCEVVDKNDKAKVMIDLLTDAERDMIAAQIAGVLAAREQK